MPSNIWDRLHLFPKEKHSKKHIQMEAHLMLQLKPEYCFYLNPSEF